jgi:CRISPR/Cas system-associated protein endoribonuclease Cas2
VTPEEFIDALFGKGWTTQQLPVFLHILKQMDEDAKRYHQVREVMASGNISYVADKKALYEIDELVDSARNRGLL